MIGRVEIFRIELADHASGARLTLAAGRELRGDFYIDFGEFLLPLFPEQASAFAFAVLRLAWRRRHSTKPGAIWKRLVGDGVGAGFKVEFGLTDEGRCYAEVGSTKIVCDDGQSGLLLAVLEHFRDDILAVNAVPRAGAGDMQWGIAPGLRGPGLPRWADDEKWK
jgi:hypothetical protein